MDRQLLARATENSDAPTPGYMYLDIAKNAAANPAICSEIAQYLTRRLASKNNHNIKHKCLKVIAKTAASPYLRGQFKRCLSQDPQAIASIKEALQFRGPPDPVRGDQPYERVRTAAKEALDAIYSDTPAEHSSAPFATAVSGSYGPSPHQQYGGGGGGGAYNGGGGAGAGGPRRMEGIGNPMFQDPRLEPQQGGGAGIGNITMTDAVREAKETIVGMIKDPLARNVDAHVSNHHGNVPRPGGMYQGAGSYNHPPGRNELMHETNGQWTMKSNRGPDAVGPPPNYARDEAYFKAKDSSYAWAQGNNGGTHGGGVGGSWASAQTPAPPQPSYAQSHQATPSISMSAGPSRPTPGSGGTAVSDGSYEKQLIMELCPPGGMKAEPPPERLNQFARIVSNLNPDLVCPTLLDCLEEGQPWIIRAKALCVMEACIRNGKKPDSPNNPYADFFHACQDEVIPLTVHARAAIRDPAKRVLHVLGLDASVAPPPAAAPVAPPVAAPPAPVPNLLDFDDGAPAPAPAPVTAPPAPPQQPPPPAPPALFGGLTVQGGAATQQAEAPAPRPPPPPTSGNLLGDFTGGDDAPGPSAPTPAPAPVPAGGGNLFGDMQVKGASAPAPAAPAAESNPVAQASSMFDNMALKDQTGSTNKKSEDSFSAVADAGSAFAFINQSSSTDTAEKKENAPGPVVGRDSFDPLKSMTPNTAKQMMQFSPQQMQAMAYQQMMMQQQMQMAQMQYMAAQQRGGGGGGGGAGGVPFNMAMPAGAVPVMQNPGAAKTSFAFLGGTPQKKDDHSFDFIKDAMKSEKK